MGNLCSPMMSRRQMLSMLILSVLGVIMYIILSYEFFGFDIARSWPTRVIATATVTVFPQETAASVHNEPLQPHLFRPDGLLEVNPNGRHPIYELIEHAEAEWDKKLKRQSKSFHEAVAEYERRYHRAPPKGFDQWYVLFIQCIYSRLLTPSAGGLTANVTMSNCRTSTIGYTTTWSRSGEWTQ
jgi:hypothetical protein